MRILTEIWTYPIKSLGGVALPEAEVQRRGLRYDRRWMLVDEQGLFVSQREIPEMALLGTAFDGPFLHVFSKKNTRLRLQIPLEPPLNELEKIQVRVWNDACAARLLPKIINNWFSDVLGHNIRLVYMPDSARRAVDPNYIAGQIVSFADGYPYLLIGEASLEELNSRLDEPLPMNRFRPNFVFAGGNAYEEDQWAEFSIGKTLFKGIKPCARCIITTTDQETADRAAEPLKTLNTYRRQGNKVLFGQNVVWLGQKNKASVRVGDVLTVLS